MKVNDRIICINASGFGSFGYNPLIKGREYIIYDVDICSCGDVAFDIGMSTELDIMSCSNCGLITDINDGIGWASSKRFAKVQQEYRTVKLEMEIEEPILN